MSQSVSQIATTATFLNLFLEPWTVEGERDYRFLFSVIKRFHLGSKTSSGSGGETNGACGRRYRSRLLSELLEGGISAAVVTPARRPLSVSVGNSKYLAGLSPGRQNAMKLPALKQSIAASSEWAAVRRRRAITCFEYFTIDIEHNLDLRVAI